MSLLTPIYTAVNALGVLLTRLTADRAAAIDRLDAAISTRATAATALSSATWTNTRAGKLDQLDAAVTSRSSHSAADVWAAGTRTLTTAPSAIRSIQTGLLDATTITQGTAPQGKYIDVTIAAVTVAKAVVIQSVMVAYASSDTLTHAREGLVEGAETGVKVGHAQAVLTSATNLRFYTGLSPGVFVAVGFSGRWQVVEFA